MEKITTNNAEQTQKLGEGFAKEILTLRQAQGKKTAVVLGLQGDLGGGKTTFLQGFAKGLGIKEKILSPTFIIYRKFQITKQHVCKNGRSSILQRRYFYHFDCYRINNPEEILELGFEEIISNPQNIVAIEWSEKIKKILPKNLIVIKFRFIYPERDRRVDKNKREILIKP